MNSQPLPLGMWAICTIVCAESLLAQNQRPVVWERSIGSWVQDLAVSDTGVTYFLMPSDGSITAIDQDGDLLWSRATFGVPTALAAHPSGEVSVGGWILESDTAIPEPLGKSDMMIQRFSPDGATLGAWRVGGAEGDDLLSLGAAGEGLVFTGNSASPGFGSPGTEQGATYGRLDAAGTILWVQRQIPFPGATITLKDIALRPDGTGSVVGQYFQSKAFLPDRYWIEFDASGAPTENYGQWTSWFQVEHLVDGTPIMSGNAGDGTLSPGILCYQGTSWCLEGTGNAAWFSSVGRPLLFGQDGVVFAATDDPDIFGNPGRTGIRRILVPSGEDVEFFEVALDEQHIARMGGTDIDPRGGIRGSALRVLASDINSVDDTVVLRVGEIDPFAVTTCAGEPNSVGDGAVLDATGSDVRAEDEITLYVNGLPPQKTVLFITSRTAGFTPMVGGGQGNLCLGGSIGRFNGPGMIRTSSLQGRVALHIDLSTMPVGPGGTNVLAGETWLFQTWYRDTNPSSTSNLSSAISVTFQ